MMHICIIKIQIYQTSYRYVNYIRIYSVKDVNHNITNKMYLLINNANTRILNETKF